MNVAANYLAVRSPVLSFAATDRRFDDTKIMF